MISQATLNKFANDPAAFRDALIVDVDGSAKPFGKVQDDWQRRDFAALDAGWSRAAGRTAQAATMRGWLERGRGHSKTTDLSVMVTWALVFATRPLRGYAFASDRDQARLLRDAVDRIRRLNPWIASVLSVEAHRIVNVANGHPGEGSTLEISSSDAGSSYGLLADFVIADEVCHWQDNASALWESIISTAAKRTCMLVAITNSGFCDSWQWKTREAVRTDPSWCFSRLDGPQASWMTPARLAEQERLLPPVAFARLWLNEWSSGGGDAITPDLIAAAFKSDLRPLPPRLLGWQFVGGLDLGVSRDASALVVVGVKHATRGEETRGDHGRVRLARTKLWRPTPGNKVDLQQIEDELLAINSGYQLKQINYDSWQATHMAQRLTLSRLPMREVPPTGANLQKMATTLIESFNDRRLDLFPDDDLRRDVTRMRVEERSYGFRLVSPRDASGHGDLGSAFALALLAASEVAGQVRIRVGANAFESSPSEFSGALAARGMWSRMIEQNYRDSF